MDKGHLKAPQEKFFGGIKHQIRKVLNSGKNEYRVIKFVGGFLHGCILFVFFHNYILQTMKLPDWMQYTLYSGFFCFFAFGSAVSIQVRCTTAVLVPALFSKVCRNMMISLALLYLMTGPVANLANNMKEASRSISCARQFGINSSKAERDLTFGPIEKALKSMQDASPSFQNENEKSADTFDPTEEETYDTDTREEDEKATDANARYDPEVAKNNKRIKNAASGLGKAQENLQSKTDYRCISIYNAIDAKCREKVKSIKRKCNAWFFLRLFGLCGFFDRLEKKCVIKTLAPGSPSCESSGELKKMQEMFEKAAKTTDLLRESFRPAFMQFRIKEYMEGIIQESPEEMAMRLKESVEAKARFIRDLVGLLRVIVAFLFLVAIKNAYMFHQKFVTDISFMNNTLNDYFFKIEHRRRLQGKAVLLPLRRMEKNALIPSRSLTISKEEFSVIRIAMIRYVVVATLFLGVVGVDLMLSEAMRIINKHSRTSTILVGHHVIKVDLRGSSKVAELMRGLISSFAVQHSINEVFSTDKCLPVPHPQYTTDLVDMFGTLVLVLMSNLADPYARRVIRAICAFYYPKQNKRRTLHLYNDMLKKRKGFFREAQKTIRKHVYQNKLYDMDAHKWELFFLNHPKLERFMSWLPFTKRYCILCGELPGKGEVKCKSPVCFVVYCRTCWQDVNAVCMACLPQDEWSTDSEGYSGSD